MTTLITFIAGLCGAGVGVLLYLRGKEEGRREQITSDKHHAEMMKIFHEAMPRDFFANLAKDHNKEGKPDAE